MRKKIKLNAKQVREINRQNAHGKPWVGKNGNRINSDYIVKCYDLYKQGRMTSRQLFSCFPGRTMKAIESKVWKIRGRAEPEEYNDPNQTHLFTKLLGR
jgi:hypothetical protein